MKSFIKCGAIFITTSTVLFLGHNFDYYYCNNNNNNNNNNNRSYNSPPPAAGNYSLQPMVQADSL